MQNQQLRLKYIEYIQYVAVSVYMDLLYICNYNKHYGTGKFEDCVS